MRSRHLAMLVGLAILWGGSFLFIRVLLDAGVDPVGVGAARVTVGLLVLLPVAILAREQFPRDRKTWATLIALGVFNFAIPWTLIPIGQQHIPSGVASIANSSAPIFASIFAAYLLPGEHLTGRRVVGLLVGMAGVGILVAGDVGGVDGGSAWGIGAVVFSTLLYGGATVVIRMRMSHVGPVALSVGQIGTAAVLLLPLALTTGAFSGAEMGAKEWSSVLVLGGVGSAIGPVLYMSLIRGVGAVRASVVTYLIPPVGVFLGWLVLDEQIGWNLVAAITFIATGVALVQNLPLRALPAAAYRRLPFASQPLEP